MSLRLAYTNDISLMRNGFFLVMPWKPPIDPGESVLGSPFLKGGILDAKREILFSDRIPHD